MQIDIFWLSPQSAINSWPRDCACTLVWWICRPPLPLVSYATSSNVISSSFNYLVLENSTADVILGHPWLIHHSPVISCPPKTSWSGAHNVYLAVCQLKLFLRHSCPSRNHFLWLLTPLPSRGPRAWHCWKSHHVMTTYRTSSAPNEPHNYHHIDHGIVQLISYLVSQFPAERSINFPYPSKMTWRLFSKATSIHP